MGAVMFAKQRFFVFFKTTKSYKIIFNVLSFVFAFVFSSLLFVMAFMPELSSRIDQLVVQKYSRYYQDKAQLALNQLSQGGSDLLLAELMVDFSEIQKGDRAYGDKRKLLKAWCAYLYAHKRYTELLPWAEQWFTLDERDVSALAYYYRALWLVKQDTNALEQLKKAKAKFPKHVLLREF